MIVFRIKIAGVVAQIHALLESSRDYCRAYITDRQPDFTVEIKPEDLVLERDKMARTEIAEGRPVRNVTEAQMEITAIQRKIANKLFDHDVLLFHGSAIAVDGVAYLFTAKSGTGKSTHTRLWREMLGQRAAMVNDDKPFLRVTKDEIFVCGSPWNGKHRLGNDLEVPLRAICILERGAVNHIDQIEAQDALHMLLQQSNRPNGAKMLAKYLELVDEIAQRVALYRLCCNMEPEAAALSFATMSAEKQHM